MTKLRQLEVNAICKVINGNDPDGDATLMYIPQEFTYVFSRLIIEECVKHINEITTGGNQGDMYRQEVCTQLHKIFN